MIECAKPTYWSFDHWSLVISPEVAPARQPVKDPAAEPLDFTLVFHDDRENATEPEPKLAPKPAPIPVPIPATAMPEVGDPWAPASVDSLNVQPPAPEPAPKPVAVHEVTERYEIDYDKLRDNLGSVGGALDSFTRKLIRNIAALQEK